MQDLRPAGGPWWFRRCGALCAVHSVVAAVGRPTYLSAPVFEVGKRWLTACVRHMPDSSETTPPGCSRGVG